jgi:hypothetical protein
MKKDKIFKVAEKLRKNGWSIKEIGRRFDVSPSTASVWLRDVKVSSAGKRKILVKENIGRQKGVTTNKNKQKELLQKISEDCKVLIKKTVFNVKDSKLLLSLLYWCEGGKTGRRVDFINSDPEMIKIFLALFRKSFALKEDVFRAVLHLHAYHSKEEMISYWSDVSGIKRENFIVYIKLNSGINKKAGYKGCLSVRYGDVKILEEIFIIIRRFVLCFK